MAAADVDVILECATLAPSVHNTQPWRFEVTGDEVTVRAARERQLAFLDPAGRQLHISCGAAVEFAYLAARATGRACDVTLLPDRADRDVLARLRLGGAHPATAEESRLADAIAVRHTDRGPYSDRPVPAEILADAERRAAHLGAWLRRIDGPDDRRAVIAVLADAEAAEAAHPEYAEELARWTSDSAEPHGMPRAAVAPDWPKERVTDVPLRDFSGAGRHPRPGDAGDAEPPTVERDLLLVIGTHADEPASWLAAGRALGWTLLRAASDGVAAQPLGQAIDLPGGRDRLRHELGLVGHPQFVLRLGYGSGRPMTRRSAAGSG